MDHRKFILDRLIDKYESSSHYFNGHNTLRRVLFNFTKKEYPQYDIEDIDIKKHIHCIVKDLERKCVIGIEWYPNESENIIRKISLNLENIDLAYSEAERVQKKHVIENRILQLKKTLNVVKTDWIKLFLRESILQMENNKKIAKYVPQDEKILKILLLTLKGIDDKHDDEMLERVFSKRYLKDSKLFEKKIRNRLISIVDNYYLKKSGLTKEEILQQIGIVKLSEDIHFYGPLTLNIHDKKFDFKDYCHGASINTNMIKEFDVLSLDISAVITIENKSNYCEYIKKVPNDVLVIYLGGYYSPIKRLFLEKICAYMKNKTHNNKFYHWGDIDCGGFKIFLHIKENAISDLQPMYMDMKTLNLYEHYSEPLTKNDKINLKKLLHNNGYEVFHDLIRVMLEKNMKLEQEALLFDIDSEVEL